jgi:hypothetical protein
MSAHGAHDVMRHELGGINGIPLFDQLYQPAMFLDGGRWPSGDPNRPGHEQFRL